MVQSTIAALLAVKSVGDEILIIDNNHCDESLYQPLQNHCESLDASLKVRFYHEDHIEGYKAGALNYALNVMDKQCDYIVVVDSDYQALPWARNAICDAINRYPDKTLLQFPQYYRDKSKPDIHSELNHYFSYHLSKPYNAERTLSTGTFAVIKREDILSLGGWSGESITEDAQMGVLMHLQGYQTHYVRQVIATGVLPCNLVDLIAQRRRWIYGNLQVLKGYAGLLWRYRALDKHDVKKNRQKPVSTTQTPIRSKVADINHSLLSINDEDYHSNECYKSNKHVVNYARSKTVSPKRSQQSINHQSQSQLKTNYKGNMSAAGVSNSLNEDEEASPLMLSGFSLSSSMLFNEKQLEYGQYLRAHLSQLSAWINLTGVFILIHALTLALIICVYTLSIVQTMMGGVLSVTSIVSLQHNIIPNGLTILGVCYLAYFIFMGRRLWAYIADTRPLVSANLSNEFANKIDIDQNTFKQFDFTSQRINSDIPKAPAKTPLKKRLRAWLVHLTFWESGALSWLPVLWGREKPFINTPKVDTQVESMVLKRATLSVLPKLLIGLNFLTLIVVAPLSLGLALCALTVLIIKLLSAYVVVENFDAANSN